MVLSNEHTFKADNRHIVRFLCHTSLGQLALISETHVIIPVPRNGFDCHSIPENINHAMKKEGKKKVQGLPQSQAAAHLKHKEEEETDKTKQAQIEQTYEKH